MTRGMRVLFLVFTVSLGWAIPGAGADRSANDPGQRIMSESQRFETAMVETLAFYDFESGVPEGWETVDLTCEPHWHITTSGAFDGFSYFCGLETPLGNGYLDLWEEYLETPDIAIPEGTSVLTLHFVHKVDTEAPEDPVWDGSAVFLSEEGGPFHVIIPQNGYTVDSLRAFEYRGQRGVPGWTGLGDEWLPETFDLGDYAENGTVRVRYTFVSDVMVNSFDDVYSGVWMDEIVLTGDGDTLFFDDGGDTAPSQMSFSTPCYGDFWKLTNDNIALYQQYGRLDYPPEGWTPGQFSMVCDDRRLINAALVSPIFTLSADAYSMVSFYSLVEVPDFDGDGDYIMEDYFNVEISSEESNFLAWHNLLTSHGASGNDSTWEVYDWDRAAKLKLHDYRGRQIKLRWRLHTDGDENGGDGCDWDPCQGRGLFVDDVLLAHRHIPGYESLRLDRIIIPFPNHVWYMMPIFVEVTNLGTDILTLFIYYEVLDEKLSWVCCEHGPPPQEANIPGGETRRVTLEWTPSFAGLYYIRAIAISSVINDIRDTLVTPSPFRVVEANEAIMGYFDRFSKDTAYVDVQSGEGPVLFFSTEDHFGEPCCPGKVYFLEELGIKGSQLNGPFELCVVEDSSLQCSFSRFVIDGPQDVVEIQFSDVWSPYIWVEDEFWLHIRATEQTEGQFITRGVSLDSSRNWLFENGNLQPFPESWEITVKVYEAYPEQPHWGGDVTGDGVINVLDVLAVVNHILAVQILDCCAQCKADCTGDGVINILDVLSIANIILGTIQECPGYWSQ
jgi:hypothetical protein